MIKSVTVTNYLGESLEIELMKPEKSGFNIYDITGLGPVKSNINTTKLSTNDGSVFNSSRAQERNIVLMMKFMDEPTIEDVRQKSYKYFPIKKQLRLLIQTDNRSCTIFGYVESNEPVIFSSEEYTQISIICPNPYFYALDKTTTVFVGVESGFEFPFSNESLNTDLIEFGEIKNEQVKTINYSGDAEIGIIITIRAIGEATNVMVYNTETRELMKIDTVKLTAMTGYGIIKGDVITISTVNSDKFITLLRDGEYVNILNCLNRDADWFQLSKGENIFAYHAETGALNLEFQVENQTVYEGV